MVESLLIGQILSTFFARANEVESFKNLAHTTVHLLGHRLTSTFFLRALPLVQVGDAFFAVERVARVALSGEGTHHELTKSACEVVDGPAEGSMLVDVALFRL